MIYKFCELNTFMIFNNRLIKFSIGKYKYVLLHNLDSNFVDSYTTTNPHIYVKIDIKEVSHYENYYYCNVSIININKNGIIYVLYNKIFIPDEIYRYIYYNFLCIENNK